MGRVAAFTLVAAVVLGGCIKATPVRVAVSFGSNWALGPIVMTDGETATIKQVALETLREAFNGFQVEFSEGNAGERAIRLDRNLMRTGATQIGANVSSVSLDGVYLTLLTVAGCKDLASCPGKTRAEMVTALGRGIGATAAHELGHQAGFGFGIDARCDDCYDAGSAKSYAHFFGTKRWSPRAQAIMNRVLLRQYGHELAH
jgi:hypothetical protein